MEVRQPLPDRDELICELVLLARAQLEIEGKTQDAQQFDQTTFFARAGFTDIVWSDFLGDVTEKWLIGEEDLPERPNEGLNAIHLADHLILCATSRASSSPSVPPNSRDGKTSRAFHHSRRKK